MWCYIVTTNFEGILFYARKIVTCKANHVEAVLHYVRASSESDKIGKISLYGGELRYVLYSCRDGNAHRNFPILSAIWFTNTLSEAMKLEGHPVTTAASLMPSFSI